ncbi:hypothetical protein J2S78_000426 [Salibacterium salarium]|nr:hypothetical protein [Salibacterium salarium]
MSHLMATETTRYLNDSPEQFFEGANVLYELLQEQL